MPTTCNLYAGDANSETERGINGIAQIFLG